MQKLRFGMMALAIAASLAIGSAAPATAHEFSWTGFYAGVNLGGGFGHAGADVVGLPTTNARSGAPYSSAINMTGVIGGAQAGYNWQAGTFVLGVETDFQGSKIGGSKTNTSPLHNDGTDYNAGTYASQQQDLNWLGTLRARAGVLVAPSLLTYVTGGLAYGKVSYSSTFVSTNSGSSYPASESDTKIGWTLGGGIEWAIDRNWSLKGEYLYYDLGDVTMIGNPSPANPPFQQQYHIETNGSIGRVGLNYKF